ncbi:hypothetical protein CCGE525_04895 [Rhizobium jaguaris]|uniref:Uncharacterized protein n=1 Tax=Rhizobium jaguaris TaxID=1312183 RepID=A0A387FSG9_9HYPH|nr:hypothetical protein CCGE525_04895 [Rhizobium jaguaris]
MGLPPLLPSGRRWPEGSDEGGSQHGKTILRFTLMIRVAPPLGPLIRPVGHLLPDGEKGMREISAIHDATKGREAAAKEIVPSPRLRGEG